VAERRGGAGRRGGDRNLWQGGGGGAGGDSSLWQRGGEELVDVVGTAACGREEEEELGDVVGTAACGREIVMRSWSRWWEQEPPPAGLWGSGSTLSVLLIRVWDSTKEMVRFISNIKTMTAHTYHRAPPTMPCDKSDTSSKWDYIPRSLHQTSLHRKFNTVNFVQHRHLVTVPLWEKFDRVSHPSSLRNGCWS